MSLTPTSVPVEVRRISGEPATALAVRWSSGEETSFSGELLRKSCPCATCEEQRGSNFHQKPLSGKSKLLQVVTATHDEAIMLEEVWPIGNYALGFRWGDGHDTGIYPYALLRKLVDAMDAISSQGSDNDAHRT